MGGCGRALCWAPGAAVAIPERLDKAPKRRVKKCQGIVLGSQIVQKNGRNPSEISLGRRLCGREPPTKRRSCLRALLGPDSSAKPGTSSTDVQDPSDRLESGPNPARKHSCVTYGNIHVSNHSACEVDGACLSCEYLTRSSGCNPTVRQGLCYRNP